MKKNTNLLAATAVLLASGMMAHSAITSNWIQWDAPASYPIGGDYASGTTGTILMPDSSTVGVTFSGEIMNPLNGSSAFGTTNSNYWSINNYGGSTFISSNVPALPTNSDRIATNGNAITNQLLTFTSPVSNIVMNIWSLGNPSNLGSWQFDQPFVILSENNGQWPSAPYALDSAAGNILNGYEGAGTIQFTGTFSSLAWTNLDPENWTTWNVGVTSASAPGSSGGSSPVAVPEPGQVAASLLLLAGIGGYVFLKRRNTAKATMAAV